MRWQGPLRVAKVVAVSMALLCPELAQAQDQGAPVHHDLRNTSWGSLALQSGVATGLAFVPLAFDSPTRCNWCTPTGFDEGVRSALLAKDPKWVGYVSHAVSLVFVPAFVISGSIVDAREDDEWQRAVQDVWIITNSFLLTTAIGNVTKRNVARQRPGFYHGVGERTEAVDYPDQEFLSFYSLDTAWAFSIAASGATLAYLRGYDSAPWVLGGGAALATTAGLMRISADMHWATDVATGALMGTLVGVGLPLLMHRRAPSSAGLETQISPQGLTISGVF